MAFSVLVNGFTADLALKKSDERLQKLVSCVKIKIKQQEKIGKEFEEYQEDISEDDDEFNRILELAEKNKARFKNVTMVANI